MSLDWQRRPMPRGNRLALVYRGPASTAGCPEAVAALLQTSRCGLDVRFVGPREDLDLSPEVLSTAALYAQPGGGGLKRAYKRLKDSAPLIRNYVASGGRYVGFCLGGYLAGATPGFGLLPGDTDAYVASSDATVTTDEDTLVEVRWREQRRFMYFQDGPHFVLDDDPQRDVEVLATYPNATIAALVTTFGAGRVGVVGPHPEATLDWYEDCDLTDPDGLDSDLGHDLVDTVMR